MTHTPEQLHYSKTHEWARLEDDGTVTVGITDHAQHLLGDVVFVDLPSLQKEVEAQKDAAVLESVKAAADVYSPLAGVIVAINQQLTDHPELINTSPYEEGWIFRLHPKNKDALTNLMDAKKYEE